VEPLVEGIGKVWKRTMPPCSGLARSIVYGSSFMSLRRFSPFFPKVLGEKRLVDLGAGIPDAMTHFALRSGVSQYVAVDRYCDYSWMSPPFVNVSYVNDDMLMFLAKQPDGSANVVMIAIDDIVLTNINTAYEKIYNGMLLAEIKRVVPPGGIAFGFNSNILEGLIDLGFEKIESIPKYRISKCFDYGGIYQKSD
jgi:hypothetical protein